MTVTPIPGVVAAGATWTKVWQAGGNSADGILADKDGSALVAQEDYDAVLKIDKNDKASVFVSNAKGVGSLSMDRQGRLYGAHRTERPGSTKPDQRVDRERHHHPGAGSQDGRGQVGGRHDAERAAERSRRRQPGRRVLHVGLRLSTRARTARSPWWRRTSAPTGSSSARTTRSSTSPTAAARRLERSSRST